MQDKRLKLNPNEMAFRKIYSDILESEKLTTVFRPEKRLCGDFRGYCNGQVVTAKIIRKIGSDELGAPPVFLENPQKKIRIKGVEVKKLGDYKEDDFIGSSPDIKSVVSLKYHLGLIYNFSPADIDEDSLITKITFEYL